MFERFKKKPVSEPVGDLTDPFRNDERSGEIIPFRTKNEANYQCPEFSQILTPDEIEACQELGKRCSKLIMDLSLRHPPGTVIPPHPLHVAVDFAIAAINQNVDVVKCLSIDDLTLTAEYVKIAKHIDRKKHIINAGHQINLPLANSLKTAIMRALRQF